MGSDQDIPDDPSASPESQEPPSLPRPADVTPPASLPLQEPDAKRALLFNRFPDNVSPHMDPFTPDYHPEVSSLTIPHTPQLPPEVEMMPPPELPPAEVVTPASSRPPGDVVQAPSGSRRLLVGGGGALAACLVVLAVLDLAKLGPFSSSSGTTPTVPVSAQQQGSPPAEGERESLPAGAPHSTFELIGIPDNKIRYGSGYPCTGPFSLVFTWKVVAPEGAQAVVSFTGRDLPPRVTLRVSGGTMQTGPYPVSQGSGTWTSLVESIDGRKPPVNASNRTVATCQP